ncbi:hypothetical protein MLD38_013342 [Melastoma candidum]|uniref:Uncharacterized protein n=1 Tax=Melastoma candidum TaxID=119954 RepID=A0ACB9RB40_9MYRT|nr:hypothetical protein MLD38_013342 [Melastoma candidum]
MKERALIVRKGAWTKEEDDLLQKCVEQWGEGEWKRVPQRAGLNRCRKSCRLRWLNYVKPNIKRGVFQEDEVDMIVRLHKLLGNRWSMIAGRLPGRTANDVKNYCNTRLMVKKPKLASNEGEEENGEGCRGETRVKAIRPRPHNISKKLGHFWRSQPAANQAGDYPGAVDAEVAEETRVSNLFMSPARGTLRSEGDGFGNELYEAVMLWDIWMADGFEVENTFFPFPFP